MPTSSAFLPQDPERPFFIWRSQRWKVVVRPILMGVVGPSSPTFIWVLERRILVLLHPGSAVVASDGLVHGVGVDCRVLIDWHLVSESKRCVSSVSLSCLSLVGGGVGSSLWCLMEMGGRFDSGLTFVV